MPKHRNTSPLPRPLVKRGHRVVVEPGAEVTISKADAAVVRNREILRRWFVLVDPPTEDE